MADKHPAPTLDDSSARQIRIGWAGGLVFFGAAYFLGSLVGPFGAALSVWFGIVLALWGHFPNLFARHIEARLIAGTPYRRKESPQRWIVAVLTSIILAWASSFVYARYLAPKPNPGASPATLSGVDALFKKYFGGKSPAPGPRALGFMQLGKVWFNSNEFSIGKELQVSVWIKNGGGEPVDDMYWYYEFKIDPVKNIDTRSVDIEIHKAGLRNALRSHAKRIDDGQKGVTVSKGEGVWDTATFPALTKEQVDGIVYGHARFYVYVWSRWKDSPHDLDFCELLQPPKTSAVDNERLIWHLCANE